MSLLTTFAPNGMAVRFQSHSPRAYYLMENPTTSRLMEKKAWGKRLTSVTTVLNVIDKPALKWWGQGIGIIGLSTLLREGIIDITADGYEVLDPKLEADLLEAIAADALTLDGKMVREDQQIAKLMTFKKLTVNHVTRTAAKRGTTAHNAFETWAQTGVLPFPDAYPDEQRPYVVALRKFFEENTITDLDTEVIVASPKYRFGGRYDIRGRQLPVTNVRPCSASPAHAAKNLQKPGVCRARGRWDPAPPARLRGKTLGLLGVGTIGAALAATAKHFGMRVKGYTRQRGQRRRRRVLPRSAGGRRRRVRVRSRLSRQRDAGHGGDASSDRTRAAARAAAARRVRQPGPRRRRRRAALAALQEGRLAGAVLDVFETEPLPADHVFWRLPNVLITSHTAALSAPPDIAPIFIDNYRRLLRGEPLQYRVDFEQGILTDAVPDARRRREDLLGRARRGRSAAADHGPRRDARVVEPPHSGPVGALPDDRLRQPRRRPQRRAARPVLDSGDGRRCGGGAGRGGDRVGARVRRVDGRHDRAGARAEPSLARALADPRLHGVRRPAVGAGRQRGRGGARRAIDHDARGGDVGDGAVHLRRRNAARARGRGHRGPAGGEGHQRRLLRAAGGDPRVERHARSAGRHHDADAGHPRGDRPARAGRERPHHREGDPGLAAW